MQAVSLIEKEVTVTEFRRKPRAVYDYIAVPRQVVVFTRRGKREAVIMSVETYGMLLEALPAEERNADEDEVYR